MVSSSLTLLETGEDVIEVSKVLTLRDPKKFALSVLCLWEAGRVISKDMPRNPFGFVLGMKEVIQCEILSPPGTSGHQIMASRMHALEAGPVTSLSNSSQSTGPDAFCLRKGDGRMNDGGSRRDTVEERGEGVYLLHSGYRFGFIGTSGHVPGAIGRSYQHIDYLCIQIRNLVGSCDPATVH